MAKPRAGIVVPVDQSLASRPTYRACVSTDQERLHAVLIHGAWAGPWVWAGLLEPLARAGIAATAVSLPGVGSWAPDEHVGLPELVAAVIDQIGMRKERLLLVGHSGGGVIATQVGELLSERTAGVAYVAGMMLPPKLSFLDVCERAGLQPPVGINAFLEVAEDGRATRVPAEAAAAVFFQMAPAADAVAAARRLGDQLESARLIAPDWTTVRFGSLPRLYIEAAHDRSVPLVAQRQMQRLVPGARVVTLQSDHAPQLSAPVELVRALVDFTASVNRCRA
jgi:pimeloyl-ACP methyl ester carboxylesterase